MAIINIYIFYFIAYISNLFCYGHGHNGSNLHNSCNGLIGCYGHKGLNGFKCCKAYNGPSSCIASIDPNGSYDVFDSMAIKELNGPYSCNGHVGCHGGNGFSYLLLDGCNFSSSFSSCVDSKLL